MKKLIFITIIFLSYSLNSFADNPSFMDYTKVLNESAAGKIAQKNLQEKFASENKKFNKLESDIKKKESELISQKKTVTQEEYQEKVKSLRKEVAGLQKNKQDSFKNMAKLRNDAKQKLLKTVNPVLKKYMEDNKINIVLDKKGIVLGNTNFEITDKIIAILNKK